MAHTHLLIYYSGPDDAGREAIAKTIENDLGVEWFNYFPNTWLVCVREEPIVYVQRFKDLVERTAAYFLVLHLDPMQTVAGYLPKEAWDWLGRHGIFRGDEGDRMRVPASSPV